ncbi:MAG TPA: hypothetical protein PLK90_07305 [Clostridiales bacterium]|nr:hypothetical protein [Clostridiales bacterium]
MPDIAVIDDDIDFLMIFKDRLEFMGYECKNSVILNQLRSI